MTSRRRGARLVPVACAAWGGAATVLVPGSAAPIAAVLWAAALTTLAVLARSRLARGRRRAAQVLVVTAIAFAAAAAAASTVAAASGGQATALIDELAGGRAVAVRAEVTGKVERRADGMLAFDARAQSIGLGATRRDFAVPVVVGVDPAKVSGGVVDVGAVVVAEGTLRQGYPGDRAVALVTAARGVEVVEPPRGVLAVAGALRRALVSAAQRLPGPGAGLVPGLSVGDTSAVTAELDAAMKASSLSHLTAVSGANCALVVAIAYGAATALGAGRRTRIAVGLLALVAFATLVTPEPSVVRASAMAAIAMYAVLLGRAAAGLAVLSLAITAVLVVDPWLATSLGFALSVCATAALLLLARPLASGLERVVPRAVALVLAVPLAAQLACGPLLVLIEPSIPVYGVVANMLAGPAAPVATIAGLFACLAAPIPPLQATLTSVAWVPASWIAATAQFFHTAPGASAPWIDGVAGAVCLAALGAAVTILIVRAPGGAMARLHRRARLMSAVTVAVCLGVLGGSAATVGIVATWTLPPSWSIVACDVGQGDAVLLRSAGAVSLIDTGADTDRLERCLTRAGVTRIDLLVLTHFDLDHVGAVPAVEGRVGTVLHGPTDTDGARLVDRLVRSGAKAVEARAGMSGRLGAASWRVLWPVGGARTVVPGNDASLVLDVRGGGLPATLLLGDLSASPQRSLRATPGLEPPYDIVKVAHHGSADQDPALYAAIAPAIGLFTVGVDNDYGHPRAETLDVLADVGARIVRTDHEGMVAIWQDAGGTRVWRERTSAVVTDVVGAG